MISTAHLYQKKSDRHGKSIRTYLCIERQSQHGKTVQAAKDLIRQQLGDDPSWSLLLAIGAEAILREYQRSGYVSIGLAGNDTLQALIAASLEGTVAACSGRSSHE